MLPHGSQEIFLTGNILLKEILFGIMKCPPTCSDIVNKTSSLETVLNELVSGIH